MFLIKKTNIFIPKIACTSSKAWGFPHWNKARTKLTCQKTTQPHLQQIGFFKVQILLLIVLLIKKPIIIQLTLHKKFQKPTSYEKQISMNIFWPWLDVTMGTNIMVQPIHVLSRPQFLDKELETFARRSQNNSTRECKFPSM